MTVVFGRRLDTDDLDFLADLDDAALDTPGADGAASGDREHVFDRHQERLILRTFRLRNVFVHGLHQLQDGVFAELRILVFERHQRRTLDHRDLVAGEIVLGQELADLELDELKQLRIVHHVDLVEEDHERRHANLTGKQDMLAGLRHRTVGRAHHQNRAIHLRGPGDHVLHVVGVARAVDVRVMPLVGLVLDVRGSNGDAARFFLRRLVDLIIGGVGRLAFFRQDLGDRRCQRRLAVIDVTDRADVAMRFGALEFFLSHETLRSAFFLSFVKFQSGELRLHFVGDGFRHLRVVIELHSERRAPLSSWSAGC